MASPQKPPPKLIGVRHQLIEKLGSVPFLALPGYYFFDHRILPPIRDAQTVSALAWYLEFRSAKLRFK